MLITTDLTRDIICHEIIELDNCLKASVSAISADAQQHMQNLIDIFMCDGTFQHIPDNTSRSHIVNYVMKIEDSKEV